MSDIKSAASPVAVIGNYQILGATGAGGMRVEYKARDWKIDRETSLCHLA
jgi:hypothetical protein